jgi:hypothetical protein
MPTTAACSPTPIRPGNSIVADPAVHPRALDWQAAFPEVFAAGGFDVVAGNPRSMRQELFGPIKPSLEAHHADDHGMADLYVYVLRVGAERLEAERAAVVHPQGTNE